jgi:hypothetical protein
MHSSWDQATKSASQACIVLVVLHHLSVLLCVFSRVEIFMPSLWIAFYAVTLRWSSCGYSALIFTLLFCIALQ